MMDKMFAFMMMIDEDVNEEKAGIMKIKINHVYENSILIEN